MAQTTGPIVQDSTFIILYEGRAGCVTLAGDLNRWDPSRDTLGRIPGTSLFVFERTIDPAARIEYKLVVDGDWILDPWNPLRARGGFGFNSELRMPGYRPPWEPPAGTLLRHGTLDTLLMTSAHLGRACPIIVYVPNERTPAGGLPSLYVTDGVDHLGLADAHLRLDRLIGAGSVQSLITVFLEPRAGLQDTTPSLRIQEYAMNDTFLAFLVEEAVPFIRARYGADTAPARTGIMGVSLGGLAAGYAALRRPDMFGFCAVQSPSWWWNDRAMLTLVRSTPRVPLRWWISTGTLRDAERECREMRSILGERGYGVTYAEFPEGHNWSNWKARLDDILLTFAGVGP
jgi:enterochelin esterase family protein